MSFEVHIIIVWNKALEKIDEIEAIIGSNVEIIKTIDYHWDDKIASENFAAFYGEKLENIQYKVDHCGKGYFKVFFIKDNYPKYDNRVTSSGERKVNVNLFDLKAELRRITGGGHLIHASDTQNEANTNCISLFSERISEYLEDCEEQVDFQCKSIHRNISGASGWKSWEEFFDVLNKGTKYVVLRNYETLLESKKTDHGDTDLLVLDREIANNLIVASKVYIGKERVLYTTTINGVSELIDVRYCGDGYYDKKWQEKIINNRKLATDSFFYVPSDEDAKYSLLYHALVHKPFLSNKYLNDLVELFNNDSMNNLKSILKLYMRNEDYKYTMPLDKSVYINPQFFRYMKVPIGRRIYCTLKKVKYWRGYNEKREDKFSKEIHSLLNWGYYMVIKNLRKIKRKITG